MELGLVYMNARYYVPAIGRFASADTIVPNPGEPESLNRYSYVNNNPVGYKDPSGHYACAGAGETCSSLATSNEADPPVNPWLSSPSNTDPDQLFVETMEMPADGHAGPFGGENTLDKENPGRHPGVDIGPNSDKTRTPIWSAAYGRVVDVQSIENYDLGRRIVIEHDVNGERFFSVYAHLAEIQVEVGTIVDENTRIGFMGNSPADWEMAVHLHFEVRTSLNVKLDASGNYASFPRGSESYWADSLEELQTKWVDLGPRFGYDSTYNDWANSQ